MESSPALPSPANEAPKPVSKRGRKKHKCSVCGNSAKSRCPFHSCKGCCVRAKNPCHIHVLKSSPAGEAVQGLLEKLTPLPAASSAVLWRHHRNDSVLLRTFKPLAIVTRKEAALVNRLRFKNLKDYREGIIEAEDLAFDRYLQNMRMLEVIFGGEMQNFQGLSSKGHLIIEGVSDGKHFTSEQLDANCLSARLEMRICSSSRRKEAQRQRLKRLIDQGLQRLIKGDEGDGMLDKDLYSIYSEVRRDMKRMKVQTVEGKERLRKMDLFLSVTEKVKQVESQEDFDACLRAFDDNFASRNTSSVSSEVSQGPHSQELSKPFCEDGSMKPPLLNSEKRVLKLDTLDNKRVDSSGVFRSWWKIDFFPLEEESCIDIPTTVLEAL